MQDPTQPSSQSRQLRVHLLGTFSITLAEESLPLPTSSAARALIAYLLFYHRRTHSRLRLLGMFWPDMPEHRARRALSQALWRVRQFLPGAVYADHDTISIAPELSLWIDVDVFESLVDAACNTAIPTAAHDLHWALHQLYRGDLLEDCYDDWILVERERLLEKKHRGLERLLQLEKAAGRYEQALEQALQLAKSDPLREAAHREVMQLYYLLQRPQAALRQFAACRRALQLELGLEPEPETVALAQEMTRRANSAAAPYLPDAKIHRRRSTPIIAAQTLCQAPLLGRDHDRSQLIAQLERVFAGSGGVALLEGAPGVGKSRLLQEVARDAEWRGAQVLWGRNEDAQPQPSYGPLVEVLLHGLTPLRAEQLARVVSPVWLQLLHPMLPALKCVTAGMLTPAALPTSSQGVCLNDAFGHLLVGWAAITPLVLLLDDLHRADVATWQLLAHLAGRLHKHSVLVIGAYRGDETRADAGVWDQLRALDRVGVRMRLMLSTLDVAATTELVQYALGRATPQLVNIVYHATDGNPRFILELLRTLYAQGRLLQDERGTWEIAGATLAAGDSEPGRFSAVERCVAHHLAALAAPARRLLRAAAVLGERCGFDLLQESSGLDIQTMLGALRDLVQRRLLVETSEGYRFGGAMIRQAVYTDLAEDDRVAFHQRAGQVLELRYPSQVEILAYHFTRAKAWDRALLYHRRAGQQARSAGAFAAAIEHFTSAVELARTGRATLADAELFDLLAAREALLEVVGDLAMQRTDLQAMAGLCRDDARCVAWVQLRRAQLLARYGLGAQAEAVAREAVALAQRLEDAALVAAALTALGRVLCWRGEPGSAIPHVQAALERYATSADRAPEALVRRVLAEALHGLQRHAEARAQADTALALYELSRDQPGLAEVLVTLGDLCVEQGRIVEAADSYRRATEIARAAGYRSAEARALLSWGRALIWQGRIGQALQFGEQVLALCQELGDARLEAWAHLLLAAVYYRYLGDHESATRSIDVAHAYVRTTGDRRLKALCSTLRGEGARIHSDLNTARICQEDALATLDGSVERWVCVLVRLLRTELALDEGCPEAALEHVEAAETLCRKTGMPAIHARTLAGRSAVLLALGQPEAALACVERAAQLHAEIEPPYTVLFAHFRALMAVGQPAKAGAVLVRAYQQLMQALDGLTPEQRSCSLERVPEHRAIIAAWNIRQPQRITVHLPSADAPVGRPLRVDEWIDVLWTINTLEDEAIANKVARRRHRLRRLLREAAAQGAAPTAAHLARALQVGQRTVEQDMAVLRRDDCTLPRRGKRRSGPPSPSRDARIYSA